LVNDEIKQREFIEIWREDTNKRQYNKIVFNPNLNEDTEDFNLFKGFKYEIIENPEPLIEC